MLLLILLPFRAQARWLAAHLDGETQMVIGSICTDIGILLFIPLLWVSEPPLIYGMSAGAIFVTGLAFVAAGQSLLETEKSEQEPAPPPSHG